jgi:hypothetical protein
MGSDFVPRLRGTRPTAMGVWILSRNDISNDATEHRSNMLGFTRKTVSRILKLELHVPILLSIPVSKRANRLGCNGAISSKLVNDSKRNSGYERVCSELRELAKN